MSPPPGNSTSWPLLRLLSIGIVWMMMAGSFLPLVESQDITVVNFTAVNTDTMQHRDTDPLRLQYTLSWTAPDVSTPGQLSYQFTNVARNRDVSCTRDFEPESSDSYLPGEVTDTSRTVELRNELSNYTFTIEVRQNGATIGSSTHIINTPVVFPLYHPTVVQLPDVVNGVNLCTASASQRERSSNSLYFAARIATIQRCAVFSDFNLTLNGIQLTQFSLDDFADPPPVEPGRSPATFVACQNDQGFLLENLTSNITYVAMMSVRVLGMDSPLSFESRPMSTDIPSPAPTGFQAEYNPGPTGMPGNVTISWNKATNLKGPFFAYTTRLWRGASRNNYCGGPPGILSIEGPEFTDIRSINQTSELRPIQFSNFNYTITVQQTTIRLVKDHLLVRVLEGYEARFSFFSAPAVLQLGNSISRSLINSTAVRFRWRGSTCDGTIKRIELEVQDSTGEVSGTLVEQGGEFLCPGVTREIGDTTADFCASFPYLPPNRVYTFRIRGKYINSTIGNYVTPAGITTGNLSRASVNNLRLELTSPRELSATFRYRTAIYQPTRFQVRVTEVISYRVNDNDDRLDEELDVPAITVLNPLNVDDLQHGTTVTGLKGATRYMVTCTPVFNEEVPEELEVSQTTVLTSTLVTFAQDTFSRETADTNLNVITVFVKPPVVDGIVNYFYLVLIDTSDGGVFDASSLDQLFSYQESVNRQLHYYIDHNVTNIPSGGKNFTFGDQPENNLAAGTYKVALVAVSIIYEEGISPDPFFKVSDREHEFQQSVNIIVPIAAGTAAAIGLGVILGVIVILVVIMYYVKKNKKESPGSKPSSQSSEKRLLSSPTPVDSKDRKLGNTDTKVY